jgi:hypothetical protein
MKKILLSLLLLAFVLSCFVSCIPATPNDTTNSDDDAKNPPAVDINFISPSDEESALYTVSRTSDHGLNLVITLHGYKSESLNKDFYVKNNEYFLVDVKLTNESENALYQWLPTYCRHSFDPSHNHEIGFDISHGEYKLHSSSFGFTCGMLTDIWTIEAGESYEWQLKLAVGEPQSGEQDLPVDGTEGSLMGIKLYEKAIFDDNVCIFDGEFSFTYMQSKDKNENDCSISVPISIETVYVSSVANK